MMSENSIGFLPICDAERRPLGVVTDRDLALRVCAREVAADTTTLAEIMSQDPLCVRDSSTLDNAEAVMLERKARRILIVDKERRLLGLITLADLVHHQDPFKIAHFVRALTEKRLRIEK